MCVRERERERERARERERERERFEEERETEIGTYTHSMKTADVTMGRSPAKSEAEENTTEKEMLTMPSLHHC